jgi:hypothetical protein
MQPIYKAHFYIIYAYKLEYSNSTFLLNFYFVNIQYKTSSYIL